MNIKCRTAGNRTQPRKRIMESFVNVCDRNTRTITSNNVHNQVKTVTARLILYFLKKCVQKADNS